MEEGTAIRLEHRLTKMEEALVANTLATDKLSARVADQNARVSQLEMFVTQFRAQAVVLGVAASIIAPLVFGTVFFILNRIYGGGTP